MTIIFLILIKIMYTPEKQNNITIAIKNTEK